MINVFFIGDEFTQELGTTELTFLYRCINSEKTINI